MKSYNKKCSPNKEDIAIMKPMAQKIADYIVANGIPESLENIPNLLYMVEGCEKEMPNVENCKLIENNIMYDIELYKYSINEFSIKIFDKTSEVGLIYNLEEALNHKWIIKEIKPYSSKTSGICNPMRM